MLRLPLLAACLLACGWNTGCATQVRERPAAARDARDALPRTRTNGEYEAVPAAALCLHAARGSAGAAARFVATGAGDGGVRRVRRGHRRVPLPADRRPAAKRRRLEQGLGLGRVRRIR